MISVDSIVKYKEQYPRDSIGILWPSAANVCLEHGKECRVSGDDETDETFLDRLERSLKAETCSCILK